MYIPSLAYLFTDAGVLSTVQTIGVDAGVIAVSLLSIMLCARSIMRSFVLVKVSHLSFLCKVLFNEENLISFYRRLEISSLLAGTGV